VSKPSRASLFRSLPEVRYRQAGGRVDWLGAAAGRWDCVRVWSGGRRAAGQVLCC